jgi:NADH-quinone oxidoreductase subunit G
MLTLTIDGQEVQVVEGTNLVEAAEKVGITIPTYCYHPGLSIVGQCRICFVELEGAPRLVTACSTQAQDGMAVLTASEKVRMARAAVMEFLLENHPLDCPVCDQAGECLLQDFSVEHGIDSTHMVDERRTFEGMGRRTIGPHVVQNQNRCIHCTRCVRFTREVAETWDLTMKSRGNHAYIDTFDGEPLDNPWSACVADVCPVGALTVKEFRFRARVWHLEETNSICPGCSIGCNTKIGHLDKVVHRFTPRQNREINGWWMCDYGRFLAESLNKRDVSEPLERKNKHLNPASWTDVIEGVAAMLKSQAKAFVVLSANLSNEALFLARELFVSKIGAEVVVPILPGEERQIKNGHNEWLSSHDAHPNSSGAKLLGLHTVDQAELEEFLLSSNGPLLVLDAHAHPWLEEEDTPHLLKGQDSAVMTRCHTPLSRKATWVMPQASWIETEGTYTSSTGRVQLAKRGLYPAGAAKAPWEILSLLTRSVDSEFELPSSPSEVFGRLAAEVPAFAGMTYGRLAFEPGIQALEEVPNVG